MPEAGAIQVLAEDPRDFVVASARIKVLEGNWNLETTETIRRRRTRYADISVEQMRKERDPSTNKPKLQEDETYIPRRIADANIRREQAAYLAYITQARVVAKFRPRVVVSGQQVEPLEQEFSKFCQYPGWQIPLFNVVDGAQTHGWDAVEVLFDPVQEGNIRLRHCGHELLLFENDVTNIQFSPDASIIHRVTTAELSQYVADFDFNATAVGEVMDWLESTKSNIQARVPVHKYFFKSMDDADASGYPIVFVGWWCDKASTWLKEPEPLFLGREDANHPLPETEYPIYILPYTTSENEVIADTKGRVFMDEHDQEACTQLCSAFVNRAVRASYILASRKTATGELANKQIQLKVYNGALVDNDVEFFSLPMPDPSFLGAMMTITNQNANEVGQVNFAVNNRKDSRKTATEIQTATQQAAMLNSVQVSLLSIFLRGVFGRCWEIVQNRVQRHNLPSSITNWEYLYAQDYILLPAGDVDVIRRAEKLAAMKQDWPVMQTTGAADVFLEDIIRNSPYADEADKYIDALKQGNKKQNLMTGMANALMTVAKDPQVGPVVQAKYGPQLMELAQAFQDAMAPPQAKEKQADISDQAEPPAPMPEESTPQPQT